MDSKLMEDDKLTRDVLVNFFVTSSIISQNANLSKEDTRRLKLIFIKACRKLHGDDPYEDDQKNG